jgi:hypothetical protein
VLGNGIGAAVPLGAVVIVLVSLSTGDPSTDVESGKIDGNVSKSVTVDVKVEVGVMVSPRELVARDAVLNVGTNPLLEAPISETSLLFAGAVPDG